MKGKPVSKGEAAERICDECDRKGLKSGAAFVATTLLLKANKHGEAWVTEREIGRKNLMKPSTVRVHLRTLEAAGIVWRIDWTPGLRALATHDPRTGGRMRVPNWKPLYLVKDYARSRTIDLWRAYTDAPVHGRPPLPVERSAPAANDTPDVAPTESAPPPPAVETTPSPSEPARPGRALYEQLREAARHVAELGDSDDLIAEFCQVLVSQSVTEAEIPAFVRALGRPAAWWWRNRSPRKGETAPGYVTLQDLATFRVQGATRHTWKRWNDLLAHVRATSQRPSAPAPSLAPAATSTPPPAVTLAPTVAAETSTPPPPALPTPSRPAETSTPRTFRTAEDFRALDVAEVGSIVCGLLSSYARALVTVTSREIACRFFGGIVQRRGWGEFDLRVILWHWRLYLDGARERFGKHQGDTHLVRIETNHLTEAMLVSEHAAALRWWEALHARTREDLAAGRSLPPGILAEAENLARTLAPVAPRPSAEELRAVIVQTPDADGTLAAELPADLAGPTRAEPAPGVSKAPTGS